MEPPACQVWMWNFFRFLFTFFLGISPGMFAVLTPFLFTYCKKSPYEEVLP